MATTTKVFVPVDTTARSLGADAVAAPSPPKQSAAARRSTSCATARAACTGSSRSSRSIVDGTRIAYGPVAAADVPGLFDAKFLTGGKHALALGPTEKIDYLAKQTRLTFARVGIIDPLSLDDYRAHGGYRGLANALKMTRRADRRHGHGFGPARPRRRRVPDRHQVEDRARRGRPTRSTSSATRTRAIRARSPIA